MRQFTTCQATLAPPDGHVECFKCCCQPHRLGAGALLLAQGETVKQIEDGLLETREHVNQQLESNLAKAVKNLIKSASFLAQRFHLLESQLRTEVCAKIQLKKSASQNYLS